MNHLKELSPSGIDFEFQALSLQNDYRELKMVLEMIEYSMETNQDFELVQAFLNLFLKVYINELLF
jgi:U3 small nucleolar RNA-associated protein 21